MDGSHSQPADIGSCHWLETTSGFLTLAPSHWLSPITRTVCADMALAQEITPFSELARRRLHSKEAVEGKENKRIGIKREIQ